MYIGRYMEGIAQTTKIRETIGVILQKDGHASKFCAGDVRNCEIPCMQRLIWFSANNIDWW